MYYAFALLKFQHQSRTRLSCNQRTKAAVIPKYYVDKIRKIVEL